jgi:hypothetical protein
MSAAAKEGGGVAKEGGCVATMDAEDPDQDVNNEDDDMDFDVAVDDDGDDVVIEPEVPAVDDENFYVVPPVYQRARELFFTPDVHNGNDIELKWTEPQEVELRSFLVEKMGFSEDRVNSGIKRLQDAQQKKAQQRLDSFFKPVASVSSSSSTSAAAGAKRKAEEVTKGKGKTAAPGNNKFAKKR